MDALSPFFVAAVVFGAAGFILGALQRERRYRRQAVDNLALANTRADKHRHAGPGPDALADSDDDDDDDGDTLGAVHSQTGRRAISRPELRARPGRYAAGRNPRFADAAPVMAGGADFDCG